MCLRADALFARMTRSLCITFREHFLHLRAVGQLVQYVFQLMCLHSLFLMRAPESPNRLVLKSYDAHKTSYLMGYRGHGSIFEATDLQKRSDVLWTRLGAPNFGSVLAAMLALKTPKMAPKLAKMRRRSPIIASS